MNIKIKRNSIFIYKEFFLFTDNCLTFILDLYKIKIKYISYTAKNLKNEICFVVQKNNNLNETSFFSFKYYKI
jgi:hypothetical protein